MKINETTDYKQFSIIKANRKVNANHVNKLKEAISKNNLLRINPIIVDGGMNIIDGQHRLEAPRQLKLSVFYIVDSTIGDMDIASLNSNKSNWLPSDYVNYYASKGNEDYQKLLKFVAAHKVSVSMALELIGSSSKNVLADCRAGTWQYKNEGRLQTLLDEAKIFSQFEFTKERRFLVALEQCMAAPEYTTERMTAKYLRDPQRLKTRANTSQYVEVLELIFNSHQQLDIANFRITLHQRLKAKQKALKTVKQLPPRIITKATDALKIKSDTTRNPHKIKPEPNNKAKIPVVIDSRTTVFVRSKDDIPRIKKKFADKAALLKQEDEE